MIDFNINYGLSSELFIDGNINQSIIIEEGCWYLCTDTAELFLGIRNDAGNLTLRRVNDAENHPTISEVKAKVDSVLLPTVEKVEKELAPTVSEVKSATDDLKTWVEAKEYLQDIDLESYAKKSEIPDVSGFLTEIPSEYVTETELYSKGYLTEHQDISCKADVEHTHTLSEISDYAAPDLSEYATKDEVGSVEQKIPSIAGLATEEFVNKKIAEAELADKEADLEAYYTKSEVEALIPDVSEFIKVVPDEYITEIELEAKGFITDISGKADTLHKHSIADIEDYEAPDLSDYAKKTDIPDVGNFASKQFVTDAIADIDIPTADLSGYYTKDETDSVISEAVAKIEHPTIDLSTYALKSEVLLKADEKPFSTDKFVTKPTGNFCKNDNLNGLTITEILAKLLGLSDALDEDIDEPDTPVEPDGIVETIIYNKLPMYSVDGDGNITASTFEVMTLTTEQAASAPEQSGFYQIVENGEVIESGYQDLMVVNDEMYYVIALPKAVDYNTVIRLQAYDKDENRWENCRKLPLTSDLDTVAALCEEVGIDISHIDTELYTVWALEDVCTGSKLRFIIEEDK